MSVGRVYANYNSQLARKEAKRKGKEWPPKEKYDYLFKLLLIGDPDVGKAHFSGRLCYDLFESRFPDSSTRATDDSDFRKVFVDDKFVNIQLFDTHSRERPDYQNLIAQQYYNIKGIIIIYDITNQDSFESVASYLEEAEVYSKKDTIKFLVGNKVDLSKDQRKVQTVTAIDFAHQHNMLYFETSGKDGTNVELAVMTMVAKIMEDTNILASCQNTHEHKRKSENSKSCCIA